MLILRFLVVCYFFHYFTTINLLSNLSKETGKILFVTDLNPEIDYLETEKNAILENFILDGLRLIREAKYREAIAYFENPQMAEALGFHYDRSPREVIITKPIMSADQVREIADICAYNSYLDVGYKTQSTLPQMTLSKVHFPLNVEQSIKPELMAQVLHNVALVHAEEWIHGLQKNKGPVAGNDDREIDVALFLLNKRVFLTEAFLDRHGRREAIEQQNRKSLTSWK